MTRQAYQVTYPAQVTFTVLADTEDEARAFAAAQAFGMEEDDVYFDRGQAYVALTEDTPVVSVSAAYVKAPPPPF